MKKNKIKVKEIMTQDDMIAFAEIMVDSFFTTVFDDKGIESVTYTPYFKEQMRAALFVRFAVDGIEFEGEEDAHTSIINDPELMGIYYNWASSSKYNDNASTLIAQLEIIDSWVEDKLELEKQRYVNNAGVNGELKKLFKQINAVYELQRQALERQKDIEEMMTPEQTLALVDAISKQEFNPEAFGKYVIDRFYERQDGTEFESILNHKNSLLKELRENDPDTFKKISELVDNKEYDDGTNVSVENVSSSKSARKKPTSKKPTTKSANAKSDKIVPISKE